LTKVIYYEYCALVLEILIFISIFRRNMTRGRINRWYVAVISSVSCATVSDIVGMLLEIAGPGYFWGKYISNTICLWSTAMITVLLCCFLFAQTGVWYIIKNKKLIKGLFWAPMLLNSFILFFINPFNKCIFYIDADGMYARGEEVFILYALSLVYVGVGAYVTIRYRKLYTYRKLVSVFLLLGSSVIATIIQIVFPNVIIQMFVTACAALMLLLDVQSPEERLEPGTGLYSLNAYVSDVKNYFEIGNSFAVTLSVFVNYNALIDMLGYFNVNLFINDTAQRLTRLTKKMKIDADHYYLGNGRFAVVIDDRFIDRQFEIAQGVNAVLLEEFAVGESKIKVMANVCSIRCPEDIDDVDFLIAFDDKLVEEGYSGELRYAEKIFNKKAFEFKRDFLSIMDRAFTNGYFSLQYQPVYDLEHDRFDCAEAFLRLNDSEYGYVAPDIVIAEAEKSDSIHAITTFVLDEVCKFISSSEFLLLGIEFVEINISPVQCMWSDFLAVLLSTIRNYNVQPKNICFNITDVDNIEVYKRMKVNVEALSQLGFRLIMDDFGAGIFEIERIIELPLTGIKLDRDFVKQSLNDDNANILRGTIRMINDMGITAAAVGIESSDMEASMVNLGCSYMQGYLYCKPMDKADLIKFLLLR